MNLDSFTGPGSTPSRRRFWDKVTQAVIASQKVAGKNISVDEHQGYGSIISLNPQQQGGSVPCPACPSEESITLTLSGVSICSGCINTTDEAFSVIISSCDINGAYVLPGASFGDHGCCYHLFSDFICDGDLYFGAGCGELIGTIELQLELWAGRFGISDPVQPSDCKWAIAVALRGGTPDELRVFQGDPQTSFSAPFSNAAMCGPGLIFQHPCNVRESEITVGQGGTATLSL